MRGNLLKSLLTSLIGVVFLFYVANYLDFDQVNLDEISEFIEFKYIFFGVITYLLSHLVRSFRLILMSENYSFSYRRLVIEQFKANGFNLLLPFKLGESYRVYAFKEFFESYTNSFSLLLTERFLDFFAIIAFFCIGLLISSSDIKAFESLFYISISLFMVISFIFFVLKDILVLLQKNLLNKIPSNINLNLIKFSSLAVASLNKINAVTKDKLLILGVITLIIWIMEFSVFLIFYDFLQGNFDLLVLLGVAVALSTFLPNGPAGIGGVQLAFFFIGEILAVENALFYSLIYSFFIFGSGLILACILFIIDGIGGLLKK